MDENTDIAEKFDYDKHSKIVGKWPEKHSFPLPPRDLLSNIGFVVNDAACGFLYTTNSKFGWVEWVFSNPEKTRDERTAALNILFSLLEETAKNLEMTFLFSSSGLPHYSKILKRNGFMETDRHVTHFVKRIGEI